MDMQIIEAAGRVEDSLTEREGRKITLNNQITCMSLYISSLHSSGEQWAGEIAQQ
jgi:hypothetical protein